MNHPPTQPTIDDLRAAFASAPSESKRLAAFASLSASLLRPRASRPVARNLLGKTFTLGELQRLYEMILGKRLDARNFQRRAVQIGMVKDTGKMRTGQAYRPARLYRFA